MNTFQQLRDGLGQAWDQVTEGWRHLRERADAALTRFRPKAPQGGDRPGHLAHEEQGTRWSLLAGEVVESGDCVEVRVEIPGMAAEDFDLAVHGQILVIRGEKHATHREDTDRYFLLERAYGAFERSVPLPCSVDESGAEAHYRSGVLTVRLPRTARDRRRAIPVRSAR